MSQPTITGVSANTNRRISQHKQTSEPIQTGVSANTNRRISQHKQASQPTMTWVSANNNRSLSHHYVHTKDITTIYITGWQILSSHNIYPNNISYLFVHNWASVRFWNNIRPRFVAIFGPVVSARESLRNILKC